MEYTGKLYGRIGNKYFDTGFTSEDYDKLQKENSELQKQVLNLPAVVHRYCTVCGKECEKDTPFGFALCNEHNTELSESFDVVNKDREEFTPEI